MRWLCAPLLSLLAAWVATAGCSTANPDCGCVVERGAERRNLACGQSACVAGRIESCDKTGQIAERGSCSSTANNVDEPDAGTPTTDPNPTPDQRCQDLLGYCNASCTSPAAVSTDCQTTAIAGDADACQQWPLVNGVLCHP